MTTPPLSACSSTTTLVPVSIPTVLIPEDIPEVPEIIVMPPNANTLNGTVATDTGSDSDESLQIIDKNSAVSPDDLPKGEELEKRIRSDWKNRRGLDFPGSSSDSSQKQDNDVNADRGRNTLRIPGPRLTIDSNVNIVEDNTLFSPTPTPISPTKQRFLSLSPLRTFLSPRLITDSVRSMSAHPSPSSSPYATSSRNIFFRSSTSLATSSMMRLPLSSGRNDNSISRKLFGKGKEKLDSWEVLDEDNYPDEYGVGTDYPSSLLSAIQSLKLSPSFHVGNSPARSQSFNIGERPPVSTPTRTIQVPQDGAMREEQSLVLSQTHQGVSSRDRNGPSAVLIDRQIWRSPTTTSTPTGPSSCSADSPPARPISPVLHLHAPSQTPSILQHTLPPVHPSPLTEDQAPSSIIYQQALDTPLPETPHYRTRFDVAANDAVLLNDPENVSAKSIVSARFVPDPLSDSVSAGRSTPLIPSLSLKIVNQINFTEEPMTPNRHHYTGRPLPRPPPSVIRTNIDSTFAPEVSVYDTDTEGRSSACCPEGLLIDLDDASARCPERLLIDLDDTSLDDGSISGASTPPSDGARLRSQLPLTITPSFSATESTMESGSQRSAVSDSAVRGRSSPTSDVNGPFEPTELDLLVSRLADGEDHGSDYEVSSGHPGWPTPSLNNSPDIASGLRVNRTGKPDCPDTVPPTIYLAPSQRQCQHLTHWASRS